MKDLFVTYEIALKLKELGFNEDCLLNYNPNGVPFWKFKAASDEEDYTLSIGDIIKTRAEDYIEAPLYQQIINWLYKEYGLWITIEDNTHSEPTDKLPNGFRFYITEYGHCMFGMDESGYTYPPQKTLELAIIECLKLIENNG